MADRGTESNQIINTGKDSIILDWLESVGVKDTQSGYLILTRLIKNSRGHCLPDHMLTVLSRALVVVGSPDRVLAGLDRLISIHPQDQELINNLIENPRRLEILARVFAGSQFLTEIVLRNPHQLDQIFTPQKLVLPKSANEFFIELQHKINSKNSDVEFHNIVRNYQRKELLRIGVSDLLGLLDLTTVTSQLSGLAEAVIETCLQYSANMLGRSTEDFAVIGMGKLGGNELNYSSDIDLLFITLDDPSQYVRLGERLIDAVSSVTEAGFLYRVDMRLRPWGRVGALVTSLPSYLKYLNKDARLWEKQALLKARFIAGDREFGTTFLQHIQEFLFDGTPEEVRQSVLEMKLRTEKALRYHGKEVGEVKLGQGSIRDVEFVVQFLQLAYGGENPSIRSYNTLEGLTRLRAAHLLNHDDARILTEGYVFLRVIEHYLQLNEYRQTHQLPSQPAALDDLSRRLGFPTNSDSAHLMTRYLQHSSAIRSIFLRIVGYNKMPMSESNQVESVKSSNFVDNHIQRMDPSYTETFSQEEIHRHADMAATLDEDHLVVLDPQRLEDGRWRVTIVAYDYLGELSIICGLMFVHRLDIHGGEVFTYEVESTPGASKFEKRRKIVDVITVEPENPDFSPETWDRYAEELSSLLQLMDQGKRRIARGELAKRVASVFQETAIEMSTLYPIEIEIDNDSSERYTVFLIESMDTIGFLYELTNALAYSEIYIARVTIDSSGKRIRDILYVCNTDGEKITDPKRLGELRAAIVLIKHFTHLLPHSPNPESALLHFRDFIAQLFENPDWTDELTSLVKPEVLNGLARLLGVSDFLWDDFLRLQYTNLYPIVRDVDALETQKTREQLQIELEEGLLPIHDGPQPPNDNASWIKFINEFKDREMFRIDMRHILGHTKEFWDFADELTDLAEVIVNSTYHLTAEDMRTVHGNPLLTDNSTSQMTIVALGKCGGREMGFASDVELMFIYEGNGSTSGPNVISSAEFHERSVQSFIRSIYTKREGIFQIDLQLRPYGKAGALAVSLEAFKRYFSPSGPAWAYERQALVRLRPIAGDEKLGKMVTALRDEFIYTGIPFDVTAMRAMRERQIRHLVAAGSFHPKFSPGGLVDVEYLVQGLQITHGYEFPQVQNPNTRIGMQALNKIGILKDDDYTKLRKGHTFLRWLIDSLRVVRGNAKDVTIPPLESEEFTFLARRLRFGSDINRLQSDLIEHTSNILEINNRLLI